MIHVFSGWYCNGWSVTVCNAGDKWSWGLNILCLRDEACYDGGTVPFFGLNISEWRGLSSCFTKYTISFGFTIFIVTFLGYYGVVHRAALSFFLKNSKIVLDFGWDIALLMCLKRGLWYLRKTWVHPYCNMRRMTSRVKCNGFVTLEL